MPGYSEYDNDISDYGQGFIDWLTEFSAAQPEPGPDTIDLVIIYLNVISRLRTVLTREEMDRMAHRSLALVDSRAKEEGTVVAEDWRDLGDDGYEMYRALENIPDDLSALDERS